MKIDLNAIKAQAATKQATSVKAARQSRVRVGLEVPADFELKSPQDYVFSPASIAYFEGNEAVKQGLDALATSFAAMHPHTPLMTSFEQLVYGTHTADPKQPTRFILPSGWKDIFKAWLMRGRVHFKGKQGLRTSAELLANMKHVCSEAEASHVLSAMPTGHAFPCEMFLAVPETAQLAASKWLYFDGKEWRFAALSELVAPEQQAPTKAKAKAGKV